MLPSKVSQNQCILDALQSTAVGRTRFLSLLCAIYISGNAEYTTGTPQHHNEMLGILARWEDWQERSGAEPYPGNGYDAGYSFQGFTLQTTTAGFLTARLFSSTWLISRLYYLRYKFRQKNVWSAAQPSCDFACCWHQNMR